MPPDRVGQWHRDLVGVDGGVPTRTTIFRTLYSTNTTADINAAIAACPSGQVVLLSAGTYTLSPPLILKSEMTLRGAGDTNTVLNFFGASGLGNIYMPGINYGQGTANGAVSCIVNWTSGFTQGGSNIVVNAVSNIVVGDLIVLDQLNDEWEVTSLGYENRNTGAGRAGGFRSQEQIVQVKAVNSTTLTIWPPLQMPNWSSGRTPQVWKPSTAWGGWLTGCGVESLTVDGTATTNNWDSYGANFYLFGVANCWLSDLRSLNPKGCHVNPFGAYRCEIRHSYFFGKGGGTLSYGLLPIFTFSTLVEDNILEKTAGPLILGNCSSGNVVGFNYVTNVYQTGANGYTLCSSAVHDAYTCMNVFEGNYGTGLDSDLTHGASGYNTSFRNRWLGWAPAVFNGNGQPMVPAYRNLFAVQLDPTNHYYTMVGSILGVVGVHTNYEGTPALGFPDGSIYKLGYADTYNYNNWLGNGLYWTNDPGVVTTLYRHGNWDAVTATNGGVVWNPTNADHTIPDSLVYSSKPAWFGSCPWPPYDPLNVTSASIDRTNIPAGRRFVFGPAPLVPPSNLRVGTAILGKGSL